MGTDDTSAGRVGRILAALDDAQQPPLSAPTVVTSPGGDPGGSGSGAEPAGERPGESLPDPPPEAVRAPMISGRAALAAVVLALIVLAVVVPKALLSGGEVEALPEQAPAATATGAPLGSEPVSSAASGATDAGPAGSPLPVGGASPTAEVFVHVVGQVRRPGVVRLAAGSRVADALARAGGATRRADVSAVNLARPVVDGEQLVIPKPGESTPPAPGPGAAPGAGDGSAPGGGGGGSSGADGGAGASGALVDLNTATEAELDTLPGVGPVIAGRIIEWRQQHGRFTSVEELGEVTGIGDATLERLRPLVRV